MRAFLNFGYIALKLKVTTNYYFENAYNHQCVNRPMWRSHIDLCTNANGDSGIAMADKGVKITLDLKQADSSQHSISATILQYCICECLPKQHFKPQHVNCRHLCKLHNFKLFPATWAFIVSKQHSTDLIDVFSLKIFN